MQVFMLGGLREMNTWFLMQVFMLTWAPWERVLAGLYPTLRYNILSNFITFVSFLCLIAFVKIIMHFPMGTSEHKPECVRFSCCVVSSVFGEITGCGRHSYIVACSAWMELLKVLNINLLDSISM
jgi:hypothetical protein